MFDNQREVTAVLPPGVMCQQTAIGLHAVTQGGGIPLEGPSPAAALPSCNLRPLPLALSFQDSSQEC